MLRVRLLLVAPLMVLAGWLSGADIGDDPVAALKKSAESGKPVLILVRQSQNIGSLDAGYWLAEEALADVVAKFECAMIWDAHSFLKDMPNAPRNGLLFLTPKAELICNEEIPMFKSQLRERLELVLKHPQSADELSQAAAAEMARGANSTTIDTSNFKRAVDVLRNVGRADEALPLQLVLNGVSLLAMNIVPPADTLAAEELEIEARAHAAARLNSAANLLEKFQNADAPDKRPNARVLKAALRSAARYLSREDAPAQKALAGADGALDAFSNDPASEDALKLARKTFAELMPTLKNDAGELGKKAQALREKFNQRHPESFLALMPEFGKLLQDLRKGKDTEEKGRALTLKLLAMPMTQKELSEASGYLLYAILQLKLDDQLPVLARRIENELRVGRSAADVFLDLADEAYAGGATDEAASYWKAAEKAADKGESPTLFRTARAMRALGDGSGSPNRTKWAKREVLDVVVLVEDYASYLAAISQWTDKQFFPVLFKDDLYAPKFVAAFKPADVVLVPRKDGTAEGFGAMPTAEQFRRAIASSWVEGKAKAELPQTISTDALRERLEKSGAKPLGVVFGDGESGEMAGALALAAGRFQGFEILPRPPVGAENKIGGPENYMSQAGMWAMAKSVLAELHNWGLPRDDHWAYVTLAGAYPFRYSGEVSSYGFGSTYAVDDFLGRELDSTRIAVTGRLMGDAARSSYQAMCSMFLQPESAFLFNTYGTDPKTIWGQYRMTFAEYALKDRMKITHFQNAESNIDTFRGRVLPWNRDQFMLINSSGGPFSWSVGGGGGTGDDMPVGGPCAIHVVHSGSAAELYNPDSMAGRAVWGGAFWYFGSSAEPFLTSFNPPRYVAPRFAAGAPLAACFRQRTAQNFFQPWRLLLVGDPQFCLRDKPIKRKSLNEAKEVGDVIRMTSERLRPFESLEGGIQTTEKLAETTLRYLRLIGNHDRAGTTAAATLTMERLNSGLLAMVLEESIKNGDAAQALLAWKKASEDASKNYTCQVYARLAASHLMDKALAAKDFKEFSQRFAELLTTNPAGNFVERFTSRLPDLAEKMTTEDLNVAAADAKLGKVQPVLKMIALRRKAEWKGDDKAEALKTFAEIVKNQPDAGQLARPFADLTTAMMAKVPGATPAEFIADIKALFPADSAEIKRLANHLSEYEARQTLHKDWLLLGPFKDQAIGAWAKVGPAAGKTAPDFSAKFEEDGKPIEWKRPFKPEDTGIVDLLNTLNPNQNVYCYAAATVDVEKDCAGVLLIGSDDGVTVWLDGKQIHSNPAARGVTIDQDKVQVRLTAGSHSLVLRIDQGGGGWGFCARFAEKNGKAALAGVKLKCPEK